MKLPKGFGPDPSLQGELLRVMINHAEMELLNYGSPKNPAAANINVSELTRLYLGFSDLEAPLEKSGSAYLNTVRKAKAAVYAALPDQLKRKFSADAMTSADAVERLVAEAEKYPGVQDYYFVSAIKAGAGKTDPERLERLIPKLTNRDLRQPLLDYINYSQGQTLLTGGQWEEAMRLADKIEQPEVKVMLLYDAAFSISGKAPKEATELLDLATWWIGKAKDSNEKAALRFSLAGLCAKYDHQRAVEILLDAISDLNSLVAPELSVRQYQQRLSAGGLETSLIYSFTEFSLEELFSLLSEDNADEMLAAADRIENKALRARARLSLSSVCLSKAEQKLKQEQKKKNKVVAETELRPKQF